MLSQLSKVPALEPSRTLSSGVSSSLAAVTVVGSGAGARTLSILPDSSETATASIDISSGMAPAVYQVTIESAAGCSATLDRAFEVL